jgi:hypothetical protein
MNENLNGYYDRMFCLEKHSETHIWARISQNKVWIHINGYDSIRRKLADPFESNSEMQEYLESKFNGMDQH